MQRKLAIRTATGACFLALMILCSLRLSFFLAGVCFIVCEMMHEYWRMTLHHGFIAERAVLTAGAALFILTEASCLGFGADPRWLYAGALFPVAACVMVLFRYRTAEPATLPMLLCPLLYILLPFILSLRMVFAPDGTFSGRLFLSVFIIIWTNDIGAYALGMLLGQKENSRKLFPAISPKKSWWGIAGGTVFTFGAAVALHLVGFVPLGLAHWLAVGALTLLFGTLGDLVESQLKRQHGMKDSGNIMPGHGGLLDRFDASLLAMPAVVVYLTLFGLI